MKRKVLAVILALAMAVSLMPTFALATDSSGSDEQAYTGYANDSAAVDAGMVARTGAAGSSTNYYKTLLAATKAVESGGTVYLIANTSEAGIATFADRSKGGVEVKDFTIDFGGHTYTCIGPAVGSEKTESQAFHLEKPDSGNVSVTFKTARSQPIPQMFRC